MSFVRSLCLCNKNCSLFIFTKMLNYLLLVIFPNWVNWIIFLDKVLYKHICVCLWWIKQKHYCQSFHIYFIERCCLAAEHKKNFFKAVIGLLSSEMEKFVACCLLLPFMFLSNFFLPMHDDDFSLITKAHKIFVCINNFTWSFYVCQLSLERIFISMQGCCILKSILTLVKYIRMVFKTNKFFFLFLKVVLKPCVYKNIF